MDFFRCYESFGSLYERFLDIDPNDISLKFLALDRCRSTSEKWIINPPSFFGISFDEVFGDLWNEIPMIKVIVLSSLFPLGDNPEAVHIQVDFFPVFEIKIVVFWHTLIFDYKLYIIEIRRDTRKPKWGKFDIYFSNLSCIYKA